MPNSKIKEKQDLIIEMVSNFCDVELNKDYKDLSIALVEKMSNMEEVPFKRGKLEIWASAIIYSLAQNNLLFDESSQLHKTPEDICEYFNTKKSTISQKAKVIRNMFSEEVFNKEFFINKSLESDFDEIDISKSKLSEKLSDMDIKEEGYSSNDYFDYHSDFTSLIEFEEAIKDFENEKGIDYFHQNKGNFWNLVETREYMQDVFDYATFLWQYGQKERAIDNLYYLLELNPVDNQGVRDFLVNYLINLGRLNEANKLINKYSEEISSNWKYSKLLMAIKKKENKKIIKALYDDAINSNPYIIDYIFNRKEIDEIPKVYSVGDENEAKVYKLIVGNNWEDKRTLKTLKKLMK